MLKVGARLKELRRLSGLTQLDIAHKMGIGQTALSRLEQRGDVHVSTLRKYVEALGAKLKIEVGFDKSSPLLLNLQGVFDVNHLDDNQLYLPIFEDEKFKSQRDVVLSIKPTYSEPILAGIKTVELRRRFPVSVPKGTLAYIYSTSPTRALTGVAEIQGVLKESVENIWLNFSETAHIKENDFFDYFSGVETGFVIQFQNARPFHRSLSLDELRSRFDFEPPQSFLYAKPLLREALKYESAALFN